MIDGLYLPPKPAILSPRPQEIIRPGDPRFVVRDEHSVRRGMLMVNQLIGFGAGPRQKTLNYVNTYSSVADSTTYNFGTVSTGSNTWSDKRILLGIHGTGNPIADGGARNGISSITVGGSGTTSIVSQASSLASGSLAAIHIIASTGTSQNITVNWAGTPAACNVSVWECTGLDSSSAYHFGGSTATPGSVALNTLSRGFAIACQGHNSTMSTTWSGTSNKRFDATDAESRSFSSADVSDIAGSTVTAQATYSATDTSRAMCAASW